MSDEKLSPLKQAIVELRELRAENARLRARLTEPIAVVGLGCRFPGGVDSPARFWERLEEGFDAIGEVPADRWDVDALYDPDHEKPGRIATRWGGFLDRVDGFDPRFFGISPREAESMDPQQRLVLEVAWEALEHAGIPADRLEGSRTGVMTGIGTNDYAALQIRGLGLERIDAYYATGAVSHSVASGRVAYAMGLRGPTLSVDTACSSSLVAVHLAAAALRNGEADLMLAGGVNVILGPENSIGLSRSQMMASDGRCKTFDARADGFVRAEGCGLVALRRLSDARANGERVLAVIRGSAVNQDGRSAGITAPNGPAQVGVIRDALAAADVAAPEVGYVETHGTGTSLGDPIEVHALAQALGIGRSDPLAIGSVKTNLGHLETAAGIAGFIKLVLSLQHRRIPPHLHFETPSPHIDWDLAPIEVTAEGRDWPAIEGTRIGGVSSFGFSGTNAHVLLESYEEPEPPEPTLRSAELYTLSARTRDELPGVAALHAEALDSGEAGFADACHTALVGRARLDARVAVVAGDRVTLVERLQRLAEGDAPTGANVHAADGVSPERIGFLFTGQGSQSPGMARELYDTEPRFRQVMDRCDSALRPVLERPLLDVIYGDDPESSPLGETAYTQPALFAVEVALAELWRAWGIEPRVVHGHSIGEYAAACVAGVFEIEEGLQLIAARARLMQDLPADGTMAAVFADPAEIAAEVETLVEIELAALNGPETVVISGRRERVEPYLELLAARGVRSRLLEVSHAFHSSLMEPMLDRFRAVAERTTFRAPQIPLISNVHGRRLEAGEINAEYWCRHIRQPVRFEEGMRAMADAGCRTFIEIGPSPTLTSLGKTILGEDTTWIPSLRRGRPDWQQMMHSVGELWARGHALDGRSLNAGHGRRLVELPTYPFRRRRYWLEGLGTASDDARPTPAAAHEVPQPAPPESAPPAPHTGWEALLPAERDERLVDLVREHVARVLKVDTPRSLDRTHGLMDLGLDSLMAVELRTALTDALQLADPLPATLVMDHPTIQAIADLLDGRLFDGGARATVSGGVPDAPDAPDDRDAKIDEMTDEEAEAALLAKLESMPEDDG